MMTSVAFFLSPNGHIVHVPQNHISTVIADPEKFGLTRGQIQETYSRHKEKIGTEGEARKQILLRIINQGWVRIRRYPNKHWSVTAASLIPVVQYRLREWAGKMLAGINGFKESDRYMPVKVSTLEGESRCTIKDLADGSCPL